MKTHRCSLILRHSAIFFSLSVTLAQAIPLTWNANGTGTGQTNGGAWLGATATISGVIRNTRGTAAGIIKTGPGLLILSAANTYDGGTTINQGNLRFSSLPAMPSSGNVTVNAAATLTVEAGAAGDWTSGTGILVNLINSLRTYYGNRYPGKIAANAPVVLGTIGFGGWTLAGDGLQVANAQLAVSNPTGRASSNPISVPYNPATGTLTYTRRNQALNTGVAYLYESSATLAAENWQTFTPANVTTNGATPVEPVTITLPAALRGNTKLFVRVVAISN